MKQKNWIPAFAGMTSFGSPAFAEIDEPKV
jgi:hypothetical protein